MRPFILVFFFVTDELLSVLTPLASGLFAVFAIAYCLAHPAARRAAPPTARIARTLGALLLLGAVGAVMSGTPLTPLFPATVVLLCAVWWSGAHLPPMTWLISPGAALFGVLLVTMFALAGALGYDFFSALRGIPSNRPAGLFLEPSHLAIYTLPLWLIAFRRRGYRPLLLVCLVVLAPSQFTFSMVALVLSFVGLKAVVTAKSLSHTLSSLSKLAVVLALAAGLIYLVPDLLVLDGVPLSFYLTSRLLGLGAEPGDVNFSLSPLVILQGFELAGMSVSASNGLGVGLGNFGISEAIYSLSATREIIIGATADAADLNLRDGAILLNKLTGEVGVLVLGLAWLYSRAVLKIRALPASRARDMHLVFLAVAATVLFVRALPYFAAPSCLAILSLASLVHGGVKLGHRRRRRQRAVRATIAPSPMSPSN